MSDKYWQIWDMYFKKQIEYGAYVILFILAFFIFSFFVSLFYKFVLRKYGEEKADKIRDIFFVVWHLAFILFISFAVMLLMGNRVIWFSESLK